MRREEEWREEPEEICRLAFLSEKILHGRRLADYFDQVYEKAFHGHYCDDVLFFYL